MNSYFEDISKKIIEYRFEDPEKSFNFCRELYEHGEAGEDNYEMAYALLYMGDTSFSLGKASDAVDYLLKGEKLQKLYGYDELLMKSYNIIAIIYYTEGDSLLALDNYFESLKIAVKEKNYIMQGILYNNIGGIVNLYGDNKTAISYFNKGYELSLMQESEEKELVYNEGRKFLNIATAYIDAREFEKAKECLEKAFEAFTEEDIKTIYICMYSAVAMVEFELGNMEAASKAVDRILEDKHDVRRLIEYFMDLNDTAIILMNMKDYKRAGEVIDIMKDMCEAEYSPQRRQFVCSLEVRYYRETGNIQKLRESYREYYESKHDVDNDMRSKIVSSIDNRFRLEEERSINERLDKDNEELTIISELDELTGISNRYGLNRYFENNLQEAAEKEEKICVCIFDIDFFKQYNDEYGHVQGDECLKIIAECLIQAAGDKFFSARYGGDEFFAVGRNITNEEEAEFAKNLVEMVYNKNIILDIAENKYKRVTISLGAVNAVPSEDSDISDFIHSADLALYKIKENGKNGYSLRENL